MTANELADELEKRHLLGGYASEAATMLRQQQVEIERLIMLCDCMTTESNRKGNEIEALKAHPVKELTDEEIYACFHQYFVLGKPKPTHYELEYEDLIDFAREILRKAQKNG